MSATVIAPSSAATYREQMVIRYLPLARSLARRYAHRGDIEDLEPGRLARAVKAIDRFDPDRGLAFPSFAVPTILGELKRHFRDKGWIGPRPALMCRSSTCASTTITER